MKFIKFQNSWPTEWSLGARASFPSLCHDDHTHLFARFFFGSLNVLCFHLTTGLRLTRWKEQP